MLNIHFKEIQIQIQIQINIQADLQKCSLKYLEIPKYKITSIDIKIKIIIVGA